MNSLLFSRSGKAASMALLALVPVQTVAAETGGQGVTHYYGRHETPTQPPAWAAPAKMNPSYSQRDVAAPASTGVETQSEQSQSPTWAKPAQMNPDYRKNQTAAYKADEPEKDASTSAPLTKTAVPQLSPLINAVLSALEEDENIFPNANEQDRGASLAFYGREKEAVWLDENGKLNSRGDALLSVLRQADDWGLKAADYSSVGAPQSADVMAQGRAEAALTLAALRYIRDAQGGRVDPKAISNIWDMTPEIEDPANVIGKLASASDVESFMTGMHPQHAGFKQLQKALLKARHPQGQTEDVDEALTVRLPSRGPLLRLGVEHPDVGLLRKRLKLPVDEEGSANVFDEQLDVALRAFQESNGMYQDGIVGRRTRAVLNREVDGHGPVSVEQQIDRIVVNMERWRWLPRNLGDRYVMNNIPEFTGRFIHNDEVEFEERIIVGLPTWPTPMLVDSMQYVVFNPSWGMPNGIKMKELLPRLKRASQSYGGGFFDQLFGGGGYSGGGARVIASYGLTPSLNGRPVDPNKVDWGSVDIRRFHFVQPPGATNPLGKVKFVFPNKHAVYMHDTTQRWLFKQSRRALSHGCIRAQNPERFAEILLEADKGWSAAKVNAMYRGGTKQVKLDKPVPVYLVYFTAQATPDGRVKGFSDIYGYDRRLLSALAGQPVKYTPPEPVGEPIYDEPPVASTSGSDQTYQKKKTASYSSSGSRRRGDETGDLISNALSGILNN